jgi:hypothetical protein
MIFVFYHSTYLKDDMNLKTIATRISFYRLITMVRKTFLATLSYKNSTIYLQIIGKYFFLTRETRLVIYLSVFFW